MKSLALITGGAGFIGSHLADELLRAGYRVRVLDNLEPEVHALGAGRPTFLPREIEFCEGDIRDRECVRRCLRGVDLVFHLAARVGVGQSMYRIADYTAANNDGTAVLLECLIERPVERLVVASSMSVYGEGQYRDADGRVVTNAVRSLAQLRAHRWEPFDAQGRVLRPEPTPESKPPAMSSVYGLSKYDQERMCLLAGSAHGIPTVALRLFNVYGPRQSLANPYTGVLGIFASRLLRGEAPTIFEDGGQLRDFVSVADVARGCRLAAEVAGAPGGVFNLGSGESRTVREAAESLAAILGRDAFEPRIAGRHRTGDIRHCFADITAARAVLGYRPRVSLAAGLAELAGWFDEARLDERMPSESIAYARVSVPA